MLLSFCNLSKKLQCLLIFFVSEFLKDHVTLKTEVIMPKIQLCITEKINYILQYIHIEFFFFIVILFLQYYNLYLHCMFDHINKTGFGQLRHI